MESALLAVTLIPDQIEDVGRFLVLASVSAMVFSMAKAGFGGGVGLLAVPIMVLACGQSDDAPQLAVGIMLPMLIVADYVAVITWWGRWDLKAIRLILPGVLVGVGIGWIVLVGLRTLNAAGDDRPEAVMKMLIGAIALGFVGLRVIGHLRARPLAFRPVFWQATAAGSAAGVTSTLAHAAGPISAMYFLPQHMPKERYVATVAAFFWTVNQIKLVPYFAEGMINTQTLGAGVVLLPGIAVGAGLGRLLHGRLRTGQFITIVYILLTITGANLVHDGITTLRGPVEDTRNGRSPSSERGDSTSALRHPPPHPPDQSALWRRYSA